VRKSFAFFFLLLLVTLSGYASASGASSEVHDVAVTDVKARSAVFLLGYLYIDSINITVQNQGTTAETFNLTVYADTITLRTVTITDLAPTQNQTITLSVFLHPYKVMIFPPPWPIDTPLVRNLTVSAKADVVPGEVDTSDNVYTNGTITTIWWVIDVDGNGRIEIKDIVAVAKAFGSRKGDSRYNLWLDFNQDEKIDIRDIALIARGFGLKYL